MNLSKREFAKRKAPKAWILACNAYSHGLDFCSNTAHLLMTNQRKKVRTAMQSVLTCHQEYFHWFGADRFSEGPK